MTTFANVNCDTFSKTCVSGCCTATRSCATTVETCVYPFADLYTNSTKYYYSGYANSRCLSTAKNCSTGCCKTFGSCATNSNDCVNYYNDFYSNPSKYYLPNATLPYTTNSSSEPNQRGMVGELAGGITGGVVFLVVMIVLIIQYCRRKANQQALANNPFYKQNQNNLNGSTIIMTNNTPQPVYGMSQPMQPMMLPMPPMQPMMQPAYSQPMQPAYSEPMQHMQTGYDPLMVPPSYNQGLPSMTMGFGQPQNGPILY